jgi:hypothetical protein
MKFIIVSLFLLLFNIQLIAQAPQGINYQAVAYDNLSQPVTNHAVSVRLSVLDGGANGPVLYQETQTPNTDNTGLFSIVIGNGTVVSGTFAGINWGNGTKWLKTEIDIAGGNNYVVMGSSQFMSVPYALYADKTGIGSPTFTMPDGFTNATTVIITDSINYVVPTGKNLYIPTAAILVSIDGHSISTNLSNPGLYGIGADSKTFVGASANSTVWLNYKPITCFLVDKKAEWLTIDCLHTAFTVPFNKQFVVVNTVSYSSDINCEFTVNGNKAVVMSNTILEPGTTVSSAGCTNVLNNLGCSIYPVNDRAVSENATPASPQAVVLFSIISSRFNK